MPISLPALFIFACGLLLSLSVPAQDFPTRTVRMVVGTPPGGSVDVAARVVSEKLSTLWKQSVVVENRVGASEIIATELVSKATPDGYTLLMASLNVVTINPVVFKKLPYDALTGLAPIALATRNAMVFVASNKAPFGSMKELLDTARARTDAVSWASSGRATLNHIAGEWLAADAGIKLFHIPYKGAAAAGTAVLTGEVPLGIITLVQALPLARSGRLRALAVTTAQRSTLAPDWPTVAESGIPGFDAAVDIALFAPPGTPRAIVSAIYADTLQVLRQPDTQKRFSGMGVEVATATPEELVTLIKAGRARIQNIVDRAGISVE